MPPLMSIDTIMQKTRANYEITGKDKNFEQILAKNIVILPSREMIL